MLPEPVTESIGRVHEAVTAAERAMRQSREAVEGRFEGSVTSATGSSPPKASHTGSAVLRPPRTDVALTEWPRIEPLAVARMDEWRQRISEASYLVVRETTAVEFLEQAGRGRRHEASSEASTE